MPLDLTCCFFPFLLHPRRKFGYVNFKSADDQGKALKLTETKALGNEIKLRKSKGKGVKKGMLTG